MPDIPNPFSALDHLFINQRDTKSFEPLKPWADKLNPLKKFFSTKADLVALAKICG
jgi:hypothetical protein